MLTILIALFALASVPLPQARPEAPLPPISWTCPMHPEVVESAKGSCPICKMALEPVRLDSRWSCPIHSIVSETAPGKCPICRRELVTVTVALSWTCSDRPDAVYLEPGRCADRSPRMPRQTIRAHGNHNPQHGGLFFMAADNWHHLEGTYPEQGVFRLHFYDDYSRPLDAEKMKQVSGRVVTQETFDGATRTTKEVTAFPLRPTPGAQYLEARIDPLAPPAQMVAKVQFDPAGPEYRFDFTFPALSKEPTIDPTALAASGIDPSQIPVEVPDAPRDVLKQLQIRADQIRGIIDRGAFGDLYIPALQAKDLALALDLHARTLPDARRTRATSAIKQVVLGAWRLDAFGDQGDRQQIAAVFTTFSSAVAELAGAFSEPPK
jgi:heavy metal-binding protein